MIYLTFSLLCFLAFNSFFTFLIKRVAQFDEAIEEEQYEELSYIKFSGTVHFIFFILFISLIIQAVK